MPGAPPRPAAVLRPDPRARSGGLAALPCFTAVVALITLSAPALAPRPANAEPPAAIAPSGSDGAARRAFERFAERWMEKMERVERRNRANPTRNGDGASGVSYVGYGDDFSVQLKPTGYARAPYVGILRYVEHLYRCGDAAARRCELASRRRVTEIFRYQNGQWRH